MRTEARLSSEPFDAAAEFASFIEQMDEEGGVVTFLGRARPRSGSGEPMKRMFLDHHPRLTQASLEEIAQAARVRFEVSALRIIHRCGEVAPGEPIVLVAAAAKHRRAAFEAADYMMDRLKTDAVFWKREDTGGEARWIEPTQADRAERARWSN